MTTTITAMRLTTLTDRFERRDTKTGRDLRLPRISASACRLFESQVELTFENALGNDITCKYNLILLDDGERNLLALTPAARRNATTFEFWTTAGADEIEAFLSALDETEVEEEDDEKTAAFQESSNERSCWECGREYTYSEIRSMRDGVWDSNVLGHCYCGC